MPPFKKLEIKSCQTYVFEIFMAGDIDDCKRFLTKRASAVGDCWSVEPTEYIYSGGRELGFIVRRINYPRYPSSSSEIEYQMIDLSKSLMEELGQGSCSLVGPENTVYLSRKK